MDKNTYETYEFLPASTNEAEPDQFFVVQDDGTFLLNRQIQYVAQVQDVKEVLQEVQPCTVYGVSAQQFFVDVDNSSELISVADQFILPDGENGLYTNSYLLQPSSSTTTEQMEEDVVVDQFKQPTQDVDIEVVTHNSKQGNNFTEITLSDEQYQTLEQKGWILLESNDKIFVLNTLGLHDITTNDKLIQKLKNEIQNSTNTAINAGNIKIENATVAFSSAAADLSSNQQETVEFVISNGNEQNECLENEQFIVNNRENIDASFNVKENLEISGLNHELPTEAVEGRLFLETVKEEPLNEANTIKIKTKFNFKDIPDKIYLGKSVNGKNLIAKVTKPQAKNLCEENTVYKNIGKNQYYSTTGLHEAEFINLVQQTLRAGVQSKFNKEDLTSAHTVISQLMKEPNLKQSLIGHNLIVTKTTNNKDEFGTIYNKSKVTLVTGRVIDHDDSSGFEHLPNLLQSIKISSEEQNISQSDEVFNYIEEKEAKEIFTIYHVHIMETKCADNVARVSVTLNKRLLPMNLVFGLKKRYPTTVFACSGCAALFKSEKALKEHQDQERHCMDTEQIITIESDKSNKTDDDILIIKKGKEKIYSCTQCDKTCTKLSNIQRHMKTHQGMGNTILDTDKETISEANTDKGTAKIYKCKMCPSTYFHSASLSKHIVSRHIKIKVKPN